MIESAAIIGLGLIGGSLARDLAAKGVRVFAADRDEASVRTAAEQGIAQPLRWDEPIDVVVLAVPVLAAPGVLLELAGRMDGVRLITDVGSTKRSIVDAAERQGIGARFVGSHPLAGDHRSGWAASREGLFKRARVSLTPTSSTTADAMQLARHLWGMVGARPLETYVDEHDALLAWTSHLPQAVSSALVCALDGEGIPRSELGPGGRDVTRLAGSSPEMWADILIDNADEVSTALSSMSTHLSAIRDAVAAGDRDRLRALWAAANQWHQESP